MAQRRAAAQRPQQSTRTPIDTVNDSDIDALVEEEGITVVNPAEAGGSLVALTKGEVMMQLDAAHKWPRKPREFVPRCEELVTYSKETAASCSFALKRYEMGREKIIRGPSVRLAEMAASSWGNLHTGARIIEVGERDVVAQAIAWDLESNLKISIEAQRSIMTSPKKGTPTRFGDSMIQTTCMAAISIALRNAIFRTIPRALVNEVYERATDFATGKTPKEVRETRDKLIGWLFHKRGVAVDRILERLDLRTVDDFDAEEVKTLLAIVQAIKNGEMPVEEAFPPRAPTAVAGQSKATALKDMAAAHQQKKASVPPPANDAAATVDISPEKVIAELALVDGDWGTGEPALLAAVRDWTPGERALAFEWASAMNDPTNTADDDDLPERPEWTRFERQPGEEG